MAKHPRHQRLMSYAEGFMIEVCTNGIWEIESNPDWASHKDMCATRTINVGLVLFDLKPIIRSVPLHELDNANSSPGYNRILNRRCRFQIQPVKHKHYDAIVAFANGAKLEYRAEPGDTWERIENPSFSERFDYRVVALDPAEFKYTVTFGKGKQVRKEEYYDLTIDEIVEFANNPEFICITKE